jgi:GntR family transcriptional regulator
MEFKDKKAIYLQIAEVFCENILAKRWNEEDKIPSIRDMAIELEVNPNTAMRTYTYLQDHGVIYNKRGIGYFVSTGGYKKTLDLVRNRFIENDIPAIFRTIDLVNLSMDDIVNLYQQYRNTNI